MRQLIRDHKRLDQSREALLVSVELLIVVSTDVAKERIDMVSAGLKLFQEKPVTHRFVNVLHGRLPCLERILQIGIDHLVREKRQETVGIDQLHECAGFVEPQWPHNTVPSVPAVHQRSLTGVQRLEMMGKQQLDRVGRRAVR